MKKIAFIILTWNSQAYIQKCLNSIFKLKRYVVQILVVDNGSTDGTGKVLREMQRNCPSGFSLELIEYPINRGTTVSRNEAWKQVDTDVDYLCILDSDTQINESALDILAKELEQHPEYGMVGPQMATQDGVVQMSGRKFPTAGEKFLKALPSKKLQQIGERMERPDGESDESYPVDYLMSACWWMRPQLKELVGMLDERIFYAPEDAEYCIRVWKAGYQVAFCPKACIIHDWQRISKKKFFSQMNWEHIKGLAYMFCKHRYLFSTRKLKPGRSGGEVQ